MPAHAPNFRAIGLIVSGTFNVLAALWIFADAKARRADKPLFAALAMLLLGPLWLAFYMSDRPRRPTEPRAGGFGWTWTRNFAIAWTASIVPWLVPATWQMTTRDIASAIAISLTLLTFWLAPIAAASIIGYMIRRPTEIAPNASALARTPVPLAAVSVLAALMTLLLLSVLHVRVV
jgi:hypothetical protein